MNWGVRGMGFAGGSGQGNGCGNKWAGEEGVGQGKRYAGLGWPPAE